MFARHAAVTLVVVLVAGCSGTSGGSAPIPGTGGAGATGSNCGGGESGHEGLRRLSAREYRNTIAALFPGVAIPTLELAPDISVQGFDNQSAGQQPSEAIVDAFIGAARSIALAAVSEPRILLGDCSVDDRDCRQRYVAALAPRVFRRPLDPSEASLYLDFLETQVRRYDAVVGLRMTLEALLVAPEFLYRPEPALDGYAMATRLSYALWQSPPDAELLQAAAEGKLSPGGDAPGLLAALERMMRDPRARGAVADFHRQWLQLDHILTAQRDPQLFPEYDASLPPRLRQSTAAFIDQMFWDAGGDLTALLTSPVALVDARLASLYGVTGASGDAFLQVQLNPAERSGLLTQAGIMAALSGTQEESPIHRGLFVLEHFLCEGLPPPPMVVPTLAPRTSAEGMSTTVRARIESSHSPPACQSCHARIDPIGFAFGHYDALGRYRATDGGATIDTRGLVKDEDGSAMVFGDFRAEFDDAIDLSRKLAKSQRVLTCVGEHLFRFAAGRLATESERCELGKLAAQSEGSTKRLFVQLLSSHLFLPGAP